MVLRSRQLIFTACIALFACLPLWSYAQSTSTPATTTPPVIEEEDEIPNFDDYVIPPELTEAVINLNLTPAIPGANQDVTASLVSYSTDLNRNQITWIVNGQIVKSGVGEKTIKTKTGRLGTPLTITVRVKADNGQTTEKKVVIAPAEVDLIWQADSYVPPFYKGKALLSHQAGLKVVAIPHVINTNGSIISPKNLVYKWRRDGDVVASASGYGKDTFFVNDKIPLDSTFITVEVTSVDGVSKAKSTVTFESRSPKVLLYEENPLTGAWLNTTIPNNYTLSGKEARILAIPYFFSVPARENSTLAYSWMINSKTVERINKAAIVIRNEQNEGRASLEISAAKDDKTFQQGSKKIFINFSK